MPIKFNKVDPEPVPLPPPTYSITGMSRIQATWLKELIISRPQPPAYLAGEQEDFYRRLAAVILP